MIIFWRDAKVSTSRDILRVGVGGESPVKSITSYICGTVICELHGLDLSGGDDPVILKMALHARLFVKSVFFPPSIYYIISLFRITEKNWVYKYSATELLICFQNIFQNVLGPGLFIFFIIAIL